MILPGSWLTDPGVCILAYCNLAILLSILCEDKYDRLLLFLQINGFISLFSNQLFTTLAAINTVPMNLSNIWTCFYYLLILAFVSLSSTEIQFWLITVWDCSSLYFLRIVVWENVFCNQWDNGIHYIFTFSKQKSLISLIVCLFFSLGLLLGRIFCFVLS